MEFSFAKFGPFVFKTKVDLNICKDILQLCKKENNANRQLAGHLKDQYNIDKNKYFEYIKKIIVVYIEQAEKWYDGPICNGVEITGAWVNFMKAGDFNPPHIHTNCDLSSVLFLEIPNGLIKERKEYVGKHYGPGTIEFMYGEDMDLNNVNMNYLPEVGDFFIFPAKVRHCVSPFKSKGIRISLAANFKLIK
jgi:hypothetical protein